LADKKIIGIHSGRKGKISEQALHYLLNATAASYKIYALNELHLETCDACLGCVSTHRCVKKDGINTIVDALRDATAVVFAAPEYWDGVHAKARAFWERVCFMSRHNAAFPLRHLNGIIIGISGQGEAKNAIRDLSVFFEDARITITDTISVHGAYACFECGFGSMCKVGGVREMFPQCTEIMPESIPTLANQYPHISEKQNTPDIFRRLNSAAKTL